MICATFALIPVDTGVHFRTIQLGRFSLSNPDDVQLYMSERGAPFLIKRNRFWTEVGEYRLTGKPDEVSLLSVKKKRSETGGALFHGQTGEQFHRLL